MAMERISSHITPSASAAVPSDRGTQHKQRRRKFTIQSTFGQPRERRSRKSRPCDACRKRKTACVIQDKPPCNFCQSRSIDCISSGIIQDEAVDGAQPSLDDTVHSTASECSPSSTATAAPLAGGAALLSTLPSPAITSPATLESPLLLSQENASCSGSGIDLRPSHGVPGPNMTVAILTSRTGIDGLGIWPANGPGRIHTLEDNINKTANFMGPTAEQDTYVLDLFRYMIITEKDEIDADYLQVSTGSREQKQPPVHFLLLENETPPHVCSIKDDASEAIENAVYPHAETLVRLYFKHVHPVLPVVSKVRFLRSFALNKTRIPPSLRGAVYMLACAFWGREPSQQMPCPMQQHELHRVAESSLAVELHNPNLANLQACLLLLHVAPAWTDTTSSPTLAVSASRALSCAQTSGLHKNCDDWNIEDWEKKLRRRLWWATYNTDCWASLCQGNPPNVSSTSYSTSQLELEDMRFDEDVPNDLQHLVDPENVSFDVAAASRFLETTRLSLINHQIIDLGYQINPFHSEEQALPCLINYHHALAQWPYIRPPCTDFERQGVHLTIHKNSALHLLYYTSQVLLYRALTSPATKEASRDPSSNLGTWFPHALHAMDQFVRFMQAVTEADLEGFWGASARSQLMLCGNFLVSLFIVATREQDIQRAHELLVSFHVALQRLTSTEYYFARVMLRPVALRIDSFFQQAGEIIRRGGHGYWQLASLEVMKGSPVTSMDRIGDDA